jgi:hypothetical protein
MPLNTEMPAWLGARADWETKSANDAIDKFNPYMDYMAGKATALKVEGMKLNLASGILQQQQQEQQINLQQMVMQDKEQGIKEYPEWLKSTGGDPQKMVDTPFTGTSQSAAQQVQQTQLAAWQRTIQQQGVNAKMQDAENKVKIANIKAQSDSQRIEMYGKIAEMKANATNAGKSYEFEQLQNDWQDANTQLSKETDPDTIATLQARITQDTDRMKKLSMFAAQVPSKKEGTKTITRDAAGNVVKEKTETTSGTPDAAAASKFNPEDIKWLQGKPTPERVKKFESVYGEGSADQYLP